MENAQDEAGRHGDLPTEDSAAAACVNCATALHGPVCHACGQPARSPLRPMRVLWRDLLQSLFDLDGRGWRTLSRLLLRPWSLSCAYLDGHRVRYLPPVRLFLLVAAVALLLLKVAVEVDAEVGTAFVEGFTHGNERARDTLQVSPVEPHFGAGLERTRTDPGAMVEDVLERLPMALLMLMPLVAVLLKLAWPRRLYAEHLVVALHGHAFACLMLIGVALLAALPRVFPAATTVAAWLHLPLLAWMGLCSLLTLRRVYGESWLRTALKWLPLAAIHLLLLSAMLTALILLSLAAT